MDERDIIKLERYMDEYLYTPSLGWWKDAFDAQVYSRWAAYEILERMIAEISKLPAHISGVEPRSASEIVEDFINDMEYAYHQATHPEVKLIFFYAYDAAVSIMSLYKRKENSNE